MPKGMINEDEQVLELAYKDVCKFEKSSYEKLDIDEDGAVVLTIDKEMFLELDNSDKLANDFFEPVKYSSYKSLFNNRYRNNFKRNLTAINYRNLENELGKDTLSKVTANDHELKELNRRLTKERDLDNDGVPDRIDIDDTRNNVQTVKDLSAVKNSTSASTQRYNEKKEREEEHERKRNNQMEL